MVIVSVSWLRVGGTVALHCFQVLMQKTLLRGETVIFGKQVIDSLSVKVKAEGSEKRTRTSVRLAHWVEVMKQGLGKFRIGTFESGANRDETKNQPRIRLELSSSDNPGAVIEFHNRLMKLCAMPYECLIQKINAKAGKAGKKRPAPPAPEEAVAEELPLPAAGSLGFQAC